MHKPLDRLMRKLGYQFEQTALLEQALTHRSHKGKHNERLEFLGDAVLGMVIAETLFSQFPDTPEGDLTRMRSSLVKGVTLAEIAQELGLSDYLRLGQGELKSGGFRRESILADAVEAIIGAIYLDKGLSACKDRILCWYAERLTQITPKEQKDAKTRLQEYLQGFRLPLPVYDVIATEGEAHQQTFTVRCMVQGYDAVTATGNSRRKAEQDAASIVLEKIKHDR